MIINKNVDLNFGAYENLFIKVNAHYPEIKNDGGVGERSINSDIEAFSKGFLNYAEKPFYRGALYEYESLTEQNFPFHTHELILKYMVSLINRCYVSIYFEEYKYTGGANGVQTAYPKNYTAISGAKLHLADIFPGYYDYRRVILSSISEQATAEKDMLFDDYESNILRYFDEDNFYLTDNGVVIFYPIITIAPHSSGIVTFEIPYSSLNLRNPECFRPELKLPHAIF